jgi:hypothetical protein
MFPRGARGSDKVKVKESIPRFLGKDCLVTDIVNSSSARSPD